jgi:hypothetical protein
LIDYRHHSVVVYDHEDIEIFTIGDMAEDTAVLDLCGPSGNARYSRQELQEIVEAIKYMANRIVI